MNPRTALFALALFACETPDITIEAPRDVAGPAADTNAELETGGLREVTGSVIYQEYIEQCPGNPVPVIIHSSLDRWDIIQAWDCHDQMLERCDMTTNITVRETNPQQIEIHDCDRLHGWVRVRLMRMAY